MTLYWTNGWNHHSYNYVFFFFLLAIEKENQEVLEGPAVELLVKRPEDV